jgi:iron complex outermembrane receptor protein
VPGGGFGQLVFWSTANGADNTGAPTDTTFTSSTWAPRVTLSYQATDDLLLFGGWTRGFKSGGFNARSITAALWNPYDDQTVDSFEVGFKSDMWDNKARLNITAFYALNKDAQIQFNRITANGWEVVLSNAGDADIYGAEAEAVVRPIEGLELRGGFGITSFKYNEVINPWTNVDEKAGRHLEYAPKYNWNVSGRYIFPSFGFATASVRLDYTGYSDIGFNTAIADDRVVGQSPYGLLHFRLALDEILPDLVPGAVGVAFIGRNVTNEHYRVGGYQGVVSPADAYAVNVYGDPRFFGGEISYRWGSGI